MRIVSWNCNMGFEKKRDVVMSLQPDIVVLQECSAKDIANTDAPFKHWVGSNKHKGMAIIGFANYEYTIDGSYTQEWCTGYLKHPSKKEELISSVIRRINPYSMAEKS
jgi:exonuclease III